jgi:hypothetical protein
MLVAAAIESNGQLRRGPVIVPQYGRMEEDGYQFRPTAEGFLLKFSLR